MGSVRTHHFGTQNLDRTKTVSEQAACMGSMQAAKWVVLYGPRKRKKGTTDLNSAGGARDGWTKKERTLTLVVVVMLLLVWAQTKKKRHCSLR
jgi:hypothetical protein